MKRKFLTLALLSAVTLIIFCGENGLELDSITNSKGVNSVLKLSPDDIINGEILSFTPISGKYGLETVHKNPDKLVTRFTGIKDFVVSLPNGSNSKYLISGDIESFTVEQDIIGKKYSRARLLDISGEILFKNVGDNREEWYKQ